MANPERKGATTQIVTSEEEKIKIKMNAASENISIKDYLLKCVDFYEENKNKN